MSDNLPATIDRCERCGCTDATPCHTDVGACHWASDTICSGCVRPEDPVELREAAVIFMLPASLYEARIMLRSMELAVAAPEVFGDIAKVKKCHELVDAFKIFLQHAADKLAADTAAPARPSSRVALPGRDF